MLGICTNCLHCINLNTEQFTIHNGSMLCQECFVKNIARIKAREASAGEVETIKPKEEPKYNLCKDCKFSKIVDVSYGTVPTKKLMCRHLWGFREIEESNDSICMKYNDNISRFEPRQ